MKKLYLAMTMVVATVASAFATAPKVEVSESNTYSLQPQSAKELVAEKMPDMKAPMAPDGEWNKVSTGTWYEGPLAYRYSDVEEGTWEVDVYESATTPGWYRVYPYGEGSPIAELLDQPDTTPLEICAVDPDKVYISDWYIYGGSLMLLSSLCPEGGWGTSYNEYGKLENGVITFGSNQIAFSTDGGAGWSYYPKEIKLVLDNSTFKDYSAKINASICQESSNLSFSFTCGADVAYVWGAVLEGDYNADQVYEFIPMIGQNIISFAGGDPIRFSAENPNSEYTLILSTGDAEGNVQDYASQHIFVYTDDSSEWTTIGQATHDEAFLSSLFSDVDPEPLTCDVQKKNGSTGYYRLVNPYAGHSRFSTSPCDHDHFIYINANDPQRVYIESSLLGPEVSSFGQPAGMSAGYWFAEDPEAGDEENVWGTMQNRQVTVPMLCVLVPNIGPEFMMFPNASFSITLPEEASIDGISADENAPVEYFNLQGIKVTKPADGSVVIKRQGSKVSKVFVK